MTIWARTIRSGRIDVFVDELDLGKLGFGGFEPEATGRPAYHPATLLKIYVYGYLTDEKTEERPHRNGPPRSGLQYETGHPHSGCWRIDGGDPSMRQAAPAKLV